MSKFQFSTDSSSDDEDNLPYPQALPRADFLLPNFSAPAYLSTLTSRHQTLEDLRSDLRERSQALSKELLDLVNANYEGFLSLGGDLQGGEERLGEVRVGLLGFQRGVHDVRKKVSERRGEVEGLVGERKVARREIEVGRGLLEWGERMEELEGKLIIGSLGREDEWSGSEEEEEDDDDQEGGSEGTSSIKLQRLVNDYRTLETLRVRVGITHPYLVAQESRMLRARNTILLDLGTALKQVVALKDGQARIIKILGVYRDLGAGEEAIKILKDMKTR